MMKSTIVALLLIVSVAAVFSAPATSGSRNKLLRVSETSDDTESQSLAANYGLFQIFKPLTGTDGQIQGFILANNDGEKKLEQSPTGLPLKVGTHSAVDVTAQPGAFLRPLPAISNQQGELTAAAQIINAVRPARNNQRI
ncbi:hypothetical protein I4U23_013182 [Adineta vaga]|nr:hypothetical protein I4U23_013182 [Adineta vaga]